MVEFDDSTGPIDPGMGVVEKIHGNPAGEIAHAVIIPPETLSSSTPAAAAHRPPGFHSCRAQDRRGGWGFSPVIQPAGEP